MTKAQRSHTLPRLLLVFGVALASMSTVAASSAATDTPAREHARPVSHDPVSDLYLFN